MSFELRIDEIRVLRHIGERARKLGFDGKTRGLRQADDLRRGSLDDERRHLDRGDSPRRELPGKMPTCGWS
jgi:hypothetical protein